MKNYVIESKGYREGIGSPPYIRRKKIEVLKGQMAVLENSIETTTTLNSKIGLEIQWERI